MEKMFNIPKYKTVVYEWMPANGYYQKSKVQPELYAVNQLPFEVKREKTIIDSIKQNASEGLWIHEYKKTNGSKKILTGLQTTSYLNWYCGDTIRFLKTKTPGFSGKEKSLLIINFSADNTTMTIYLFSGFYIDIPALRFKAVDSYIPALLC
jgi:hypothetical protein